MYLVKTHKEADLLRIADETAIVARAIRMYNKEETIYLSEAAFRPNLVGTSDVQLYEMIDQSGSLQGASFAVLNHIPVTSEGRTAFEERFQGRARKVEHEPGFVGIRVLRPLTDDAYLILTLWEDEEHFKQWQRSPSYNEAHRKRHTADGLDTQQPAIFPRPSFVHTYRIV